MGLKDIIFARIISLPWEKLIPPPSSKKANRELLESFREIAAQAPAQATGPSGSGEEVNPVPPSATQETVGRSEQAAGTACVPCSIDHLSTCSGLLSEATRFARSDGVGSEEVLSRIALCQDEINAMERVDLRPELIAQIPDWERALANTVLNKSRTLRHSLQAIASPKDLEGIAGETQRLRQEIGRQWFKQRLSQMTPEEKERVTAKAMERVTEELEKEG